MHELSVCQAMLSQVADVAARENASEVTRILIRIGPLSGVVAELLEQAFTIARGGTLAAQAELVTEPQPIRVRCSSCGSETEAGVNHLVCGECGDFRTQLISGDELLLVSIEMKRDNDTEFN